MMAPKDRLRGPETAIIIFRRSGTQTKAAVTAVVLALTLDGTRVLRLTLLAPEIVHAVLTAY